MQEEIKNLMADFIKAKKQEVNSATLNNYRFYLNRFFYLLNLSGPEELNYQTVRAFRGKLNQLKLSPATQNYHLIALRSFLKFLNEENINNLDPKKITLYPVKISKNEPVTKKEIEKIMETPDKDDVSKIINKRDKLLLELLFSSQYKVSKIAKLKIKEVSGLKIGEQGKYWLKLYLKSRKDKSEFLFIRHDRAQPKAMRHKPYAISPLTARSIQRIVASCAKKAGIRKKITPESFRNIAINYFFT
ncbi:MAG: tyrosine-type recombinase/integrase [Patescibacteria group bacterium]